MAPSDPFRLYEPCAALRPYVRCYWSFRTAEPLSTLTFPVGAPQLLFHRGEPLRIPELGVRQSWLTVSGQVDFPSHIASEGGTEMVAVLFRPHGLRPILDMPVSLFHNREADGCDLEDRGLRELGAQVRECRHPEQAIPLVEHWLWSRLFRRHDATWRDDDLHRIALAVGMLQADPQRAVSRVAEACCWSSKQFGRVFAACVGMPPKDYARIVRFRRAMQLLERDSRGWGMAQIASACGYADQSHMIREFRRLAGHTPGELLRRVDPYTDLSDEDPR